MNYHNLLERQIKKHLSAEIAANPEVIKFLSVVDGSYTALQRDKYLTERAFEISEDEYSQLNNKLGHEIGVKKKSIDRLKQTIEEIGGVAINENDDDLLAITEFLIQQVNKRKSAEKVFSSLINNSQSGILLEDENRKIVFTNQLFCDLFQIPVNPEVLVGEDCSQSAQQTKNLFEDPDNFVVEIGQALKERVLKVDKLCLADGRVLKREYIPIFIDKVYKGHLWTYTDITERQRAIQAIEQSELKNRLIMNSALDAIITFNEEGLITFWNPQAERIFGWKEVDVLSKKSVYDIIPSYPNKSADLAMGEAPVFNKMMELQAVNINGVKFPIELSIVPVKQENTMFFCSFIRDISDRKKNEEALKASEELWQFALEGTGDGVWEYNHQTKEVFFSTQYKKMLGYEEDEFNNDPNEWKSRIHPEDLHIIEQTDRNYNDNKIITHQREYRIKHKNGNYIWILDRGMTVSFLENGKPWRIIGTHSDITERKLSEQVLKLREEKYRTILTNMNLGLLEVDNDETIKFANHSFCNMSGYAWEEIAGKKATDLLLENESKTLLLTKQQQRHAGISDAFEIPVLDKNGLKRWWLVSGAPRYDDNGVLVGSIGIHLDITERKLLESDLINAHDAAQSSKQAKENFLANMSHEIRTLMNAILGMANQLNKTPLNPKQQFFLDTIITSVDNLLIIVNDILDFSKIDSGKMTVEKIGFEPKRIIEQVMQVMRYRAEEKGLQFVNSFCDSRISPVLIGDPYRIGQILLNLTSNAIKFTNRGYVDISCALVDDLATNQILKITVKDSGIGMDSAFKERLFDKFSQEDDTVTRKYGGTGLGMSISKNLIELMGGSIAVESFKEKGTSISFTLNLDKGTKADIPVKEEIEIDTKLLSGKNILVVDDNEINRLLACTILENHGLTTKEAENGNDALLMLKLQQFDLILMDVQMPVMDGIEATQLIRQMDNDIPIIALTAFALKGDNQKCFEAGMNDYLAKPFEETKLLSILGKWLHLPNRVNKEQQIVNVEPNQLYSLAKIESLANGNDEFLQKMISLFIKHIPIAINEFEEAYEEEDFVRIAQVAHRIKPSIDSLAILGLNEMIREVETKAIEYQKSDVLSNLLKEIKLKLNLVLADLHLKRID